MGTGTVIACSDDPTNADPGVRPDASVTAPPAVDASNTPPAVVDAASDAPSGDDAGVSDAGFDSGLYNNALLVDAGFTKSEMEDICKKRGGFVYVNAACAGGAMCKGLSFHSDTLWEHSCRGQNSTCSGIGCVDTPADTGKTGKQIFEDGPCANCHADWSSGTADMTKYAVFYYPPDKTATEAVDEFKALSDAELQAKVAWGANGIHANGLPYQNMDAYYRKYSRAEIERVAAHVKTLQAFSYAYEIFGVDAGPDAAK
ncbi:MAG: c-type cytochrome [Labilithrix sp.]